jgi:integrase
MKRAVCCTACACAFRVTSLWFCALRTGLRLGELLGLQWGDRDFAHRFIEVRRSLHDGGRVELPKNNKVRRVDMSPQLAEELQRLRLERAREALARGWGQGPDWFSGGGGPAGRHRTAPRATREIPDKGASGGSIDEQMVELRGAELDRSPGPPVTEDEALPFPASRRPQNVRRLDRNP